MLLGPVLLDFFVFNNSLKNIIMYIFLVTHIPPVHLFIMFFICTPVCE